jgi:hypothetical protein
MGQVTDADIAAAAAAARLAIAFERTNLSGGGPSLGGEWGWENQSAGAAGAATAVVIRLWHAEVAPTDAGD